MKALKCCLHRFVSHGHPLGGGRQSKLGLLATTRGVLNPFPRLIDGRLDLDQAWRGCAAATNEARGKHITLGSDRSDALTEVDQLHRSRRVVNECHAVEQLLDRRSHAVGTGDYLSSPDRAATQPRPAGDLHRGGGGAYEQTCPAGILLAQRRNGALGRLGRVGHHRIRCPPESGRNPDLMSSPDL